MNSNIRRKKYSAQGTSNFRYNLKIYNIYNNNIDEIIRRILNKEIQLRCHVGSLPEYFVTTTT